VSQISAVTRRTFVCLAEIMLRGQVGAMRETKYVTPSYLWIASLPVVKLCQSFILFDQNPSLQGLIGAPRPGGSNSPAFNLTCPGVKPPCACTTSVLGSHTSHPLSLQPQGPCETFATSSAKLRSKQKSVEMFVNSTGEVNSI